MTETTLRCNRCKTTLPIELFSWMSGKSRPMQVVGVCDYCLGLKQRPLPSVTEESGAVEEETEDV